MSTQNLMQKFKKGNLKAFETLYKSYFPSLCLYSCGLIPDEDISQPEPGKSIPEKKVEVIEPPKLLLANNINTREITAWKDGIYIFNAEKLSDLKVILERKYDVSIEIESEELRNHRFTGTFHQETFEQILGIINLSAPIKYEIEKGVVTIRLDQRRRHIFKELSMN